MKINIGSMILGIIVGYISAITMATISVGKKLVDENKELEKKLKEGA